MRHNFFSNPERIEMCQFLARWVFLRIYAYTRCVSYVQQPNAKRAGLLDPATLILELVDNLETLLREHFSAALHTEASKGVQRR